MSPTNEDVGTTARDIERSLRELCSTCDQVTDRTIEQTIEPLLPKFPSVESRSQENARTVIESITVQGIRSFGPAQTLRPSEGLTVIYAKNGHGKTSLTDALELLGSGITTRVASTPNAALEVKDKDHIAHLKPSGQRDSGNPPNVEVRYVEAGEPRLCTWKTFGTAASEAPNLQVLPRRLLRELVNAKRTERTGPLGAALGLSQTIDYWTSVAKTLRERSTILKSNGEAHLELLLQELPLCGDDDIATMLTTWEQGQIVHPTVVTEPPSPEPWKYLAGLFGKSGIDTTPDLPLDAELVTLLESFQSLAKPGETCPACAQSRVTEDRIEQIRSLLSKNEDSRTAAAQAQELRKRFEELSTQVESWLTVTKKSSVPTAKLPTEWTEAIVQLENAHAKLTLLEESEDCLQVTQALESLRTVRESHIIGTDEQQSTMRERALAAVRTDITGTVEAIRERNFCINLLAPTLDRADEIVRAMLVKRVREEFKSLEGPINEWLEVLGPEGTPRITLDAVLTKYRPSLDLRVSGYSSEAVQPHAAGHFSDAQIDMLGMAAHLARIERNHPGSTVVIDDPSDMLDSVARKRLAHDGIAKLLDARPQPHQVIVLTHDDQLVRELWEAHRGRRPTVEQDTIERRQGGSEDEFSVFTSRNAVEAVARANELISEHWDRHLDRHWFRAALSAHTRQAAEMCAKDVSTLLGPAGLNLHSEECRSVESEDLGKVSDKVRKTLREAEERWCDSGRHYRARALIGEIRDLLSHEMAASLNPGAHSDVVLPEARISKLALKRLAKVASSLESPPGKLRSCWVTESELAKALLVREECPGCMEKTISTA